MSHVLEYVWVYLRNSLWQVPLLFCAAFVIDRLLPAGETRLRHRVWAATLVLQCLLPACQLPEHWRDMLLTLFSHEGTTRETVAVSMGFGTAHNGGRVWSSLERPGTLAYLFACTFFAAQFTRRCLKVRSLRRGSKPLTLLQDDAIVFARLCDALHLSGVRTATSPGVFGPSTIGVRNRMVVMPEGMVERAQPQDIHAAMAHELAHVKRRDFALNLLLELLGIAAAYHPCFWLARTRMDESREIVCDEIAADLLGGRKCYARSLLRLAEQLVAAPPTHNPHAIGMFDAGIFERRIMQLSNRVTQVRGVRRACMLGAAGTVALMTCGSALAFGVRGTEAPAVAAAQNTASTPPVTVSPGVMAGQVLHRVQPVYPPEAKQAKIQGAVVLHAIVGRDGMVHSLQVKSGPPELVHSAIDAVKQWVYKPFLLNGQPTEVDTDITITYSFGA